MPSGTGKLKRLSAVLVAALWLAAPSGALAEARLSLRSNATWSLNEAWFGGFSGIEVAPGGTDLTLVTDRGAFVRAKLERDADGDIAGLRDLTRMDMRLRDGAPFPHSFRDAEGLAVHTDGTVYVSFELWHRVMRIDPATGITRRLKTHPDFAEFDTNDGLEALAVHPDGSLFALPESKRARTKTAPIYRWQGGEWQVAHRIELRRPFRPVGADFDVEGRLYLLERGVSPLGFRSRIRRFTLDGPEPASETLLSTTAGIFDNLEGISVWRDAAGRTRLTLVSDDNFLPVQRTQIVEFAVTE